MAESVLKANSLRVRFERGSQEPTDLEIFEFMRKKMALKAENLLSMYKDMREQSVIIKFATENDYKSALKNLPKTMEFEYNKYESTQVQLSSACAVIKYVRLFNLPPEVTDREIHDVMCQFGRIQSLIREKYGEETGFPIWTSVRGVYMEIKDGTEIPASVQIRNVRARVFYEGLINKCFLCNSSEHFKADCPNRKSVNDRLGVNRGASYSGAVAGAWMKNKSGSHGEKNDSGKSQNGGMTNLNDLFPAIPTEKRKQSEAGTKLEPIPGTSGAPVIEVDLTLSDLPSNDRAAPSNIGERTPNGDAWQIVQPKRARKNGDTPNSGKKEEISASDSGQHRRSSTRVARAKSLSEMQDDRSRSRAGKTNGKEQQQQQQQQQYQQQHQQQQQQQQSQQQQKMEIGDVNTETRDASTSSGSGDALLDSDGL